MPTKTLNLSLVSTDYQWTASGSGTNEYYLEAAGGGDPGLAAEPDSVAEDGSDLTPATVGTLSASEWDWGDNDTLGFSTVYVVTSGGVDPDTLGYAGITGRVTTTLSQDRTHCPGLPYVFDDLPVVPVEIANTDFSVVAAAANSRRRGFAIHNDTGATVYIKTSTTQPTATDEMIAIADGENYFETDVRYHGPIYAYQASGAAVDLGVQEYTEST